MSKGEALDLADQIVQDYSPDLAGLQPVIHTHRVRGRTECRVECEIEIQDGPITVPGGVVVVVDSESGETRMRAIQ